MNTLPTATDPTLTAVQCMASAVACGLPAEGAGNECVAHARILMIDDEPINIKAVAKHLRDAGYANLIHSTDPHEGLRMVESEQPDLVLLDIVMPSMNGLELLEQIRANPETCLLPVIILTAYSNPESKREALRGGATEFLAKPVDAEELAVRVRNTLIVKLHQDYLRQRAAELEGEIQQQTVALNDAREKGQLRYLAGKAEIASDVLHNVGNALHSVNVGVNLIAMTVRDSRLRSLKRATDLFGEHKENLARFMTRDERGQLLPSFLMELSDALLTEQESVVRELDLLTQHLDHINAVVATQQKYAALCQITEEFDLADLLGDAEGLLRGALSRHSIELERRFDAIPPVKTDRQKLLQVVLNVMKNAVEAIRELHPRGDGRLELRCGQRDSDRAYIEVDDNGIGIHPEHTIEIFSHGFTTKPDGHGFGLHSCANLMQELGGSMRAQSEGPGRGSTFVLDIPFQADR